MSSNPQNPRRNPDMVTCSWNAINWGRGGGAKGQTDRCADHQPSPCSAKDPAPREHGRGWQSGTPDILHTRAQCVRTAGQRVPGASLCLQPPALGLAAHATHSTLPTEPSLPPSSPPYPAPALVQYFSLKSFTEHEEGSLGSHLKIISRSERLNLGL